MGNLSATIEDIKEKLEAQHFTEDELKKDVILRILQELGWNIFGEEVKTEFRVEKRRVDYALILPEDKKVFIEVKKPSEDLDALNHQEQLLDYAFKSGVELALLTNGIAWWFYLPLMRGDWADRKAFTIDLIEQPTDMVVSNLSALLERDAVLSGRAIEYAKTAFESKKREKLVRKNIPKAWEKMLTTPDIELIKLLRENVSNMCGYNATEDECIEYLKTQLQASSYETKRTESIQRRTPRTSKYTFPPQSITPKEGGFEFEFTVNKSFLNVRGITIPKRNHAYLEGILTLPSSCDVSIYSINGEQVKGHLRYNQTQGNPYYQIFIDKDGFYRTQLNTLKIGAVLVVAFKGDRTRPEFMLKL